MAKLGPYTYPDIRFGDAVEIAGRILTKFKGTVSVKGLAWELGMAEGSGTLFAKVAAMRDFGLIEGRGELRVSPLAQRVLHPANAREGHEARAEAFQRVELLRQLYARFEGEVPDDMSLLVGLEEITRTARDEIVRRAPLIQKHLTDAIRVLGRPVPGDEKSESSVKNKKNIASGPVTSAPGMAEGTDADGGIHLVAGDRRLSVPLTAEYIDVAITLLNTLKSELRAGQESAEESEAQDGTVEDTQDVGERPRTVAELELGRADRLDLSGEATG